MLVAALCFLALVVGALAAGNGTGLALRGGSGDVGMLSVSPPATPPGLDWRYCGSDGAYESRGANCHLSHPDYWKPNKEYFVLMKAVAFNGLAFTRIASGHGSRCTNYWFSGDVAVGHKKDCYFAEVDNIFIKSPVSAAGWNPVSYETKERFSIKAGLWAVKYWNDLDPSMYTIGFAGANNDVTHACGHKLMGMAYNNPGDGYSFWASPYPTTSRCSVSVEPVVAAQDMKYFQHCANKDGVCVLPYKQNGVIVRIGNKNDNLWTYRQVFSANGNSFRCKHEILGALWQSSSDSFTCEVLDRQIH